MSSILEYKASNNFLFSAFKVCKISSSFLYYNKNFIPLHNNKFKINYCCKDIDLKINFEEEKCTLDIILHNLIK